MDDLARSFAALAERYGPAVADAAKSAARVEAFSSLCGSLVAFAIAGAMVWAGRRFARVGASDFDPDTSPGLIIGYMLIGLAVIPFSIACWCWLDPWTWVAISEPELWLAKRAFHL